MKNKLINASIILAPLLVPTFAFAQLGTIGNLLGQIGQLVYKSFAVLSGIALLVFFWGLIKFLFNNGSEDATADGRRIMIWGVIALFVMVSVWGLVAFLQGAFLQGTSFNPPPVPTI